jgi:hypothetical protein
MPRYQHDCTACTFLGTYKEFDLYFCPQVGHPTLIARYGDKGPEYQSGMDAGRNNLLPELHAAYKLSLEKGLIKG